MSLPRTLISGCGTCVPERIITNDELSRTLDTSDEWIFERTGIHARHIASPTDSVAGLGAKAGRQALDQARFPAEELDGILLATTSPDHFLPASATKIQALLGAKKAFAFDVQAVCSGFLYALSVADAMIRSGQARHLLVIGADIMSRLVDWTDRSTCVLFGDGAGAVFVQASADPERGILSTHLYSDGTAYDQLYADASTPLPQSRCKMIMNGRSVYLKAIECMSDAVRTALEQHNLTVSDLDLFVAHQANKRIIDAVAKSLDLPSEKAVCIMETFANTSAATIPMALTIAERDGRLRPGHCVALAAMGAGFTWGSALLRW